MNKKFLKISLILIFFLGILSIKNIVCANSISSINMDIFITNEGNAEVTETWACTTNKSTECYHPYYNLGKSKIKNLTVSDNKQTYTTLNSWDTNDSFSEKAYKCGINKIHNGIELCWGISDYGSNVYTVKYEITNFVSQLNDCQMAYWTLIPHDFSNPIDDCNIVIHTTQKLPDNIAVWGYGNYGGLCYVDNGSIYMKTNQGLAQREYMTILAKFPNGMFNTSNNLNKDFNYYYTMAEDGSEKYNYQSNSIFNDPDKAWLPAVLAMVICLAILGVAGGFTTKFKLDAYDSKHIKKSKNIRLKNVPYYRDIPCNGDIFRAYYIAHQYGLIKNKTSLLGAIILKWLKQGIVKVEKQNNGGLLKKENSVIIFNFIPTPNFENSINFQNLREQEIFDMMYKASKNGVLENKEFEKWCEKNYTSILSWFDNILNDQKDLLIKENLISEKKGRFINSLYETTALRNEAIQLAGLKKFLLEYTLIKEKESIEVVLFENYLIFAQLFGIAKQVAKQFKDIYPDLIEQTCYTSYDNLSYISYISYNCVSSATTAAQAYSSGGGGFSSGGGRRRILWWWRRPEVAFVNPKFLNLLLNI